MFAKLNHLAITSDHYTLLGMFYRAAATEFTFHTLADSVDELVGYLHAKWRQLHFADADLSRARDILARSPGNAIAVTERVTACRLAGVFCAEDANTNVPRSTRD